jgi:hypothetical protein
MQKMENNNTLEELRNKILKGIEIAFENLVAKKKKDDSEFVFSKDGKIIKVKAKDL